MLVRKFAMNCRTKGPQFEPSSCWGATIFNVLIFQPTRPVISLLSSSSFGRRRPINLTPSSLSSSYSFPAIMLSPLISSSCRCCCCRNFAVSWSNLFSINLITGVNLVLLNDLPSEFKCTIVPILNDGSSLVMVSDQCESWIIGIIKNSFSMRQSFLKCWVASFVAIRSWLLLLSSGPPPHRLLLALKIVVKLIASI